MLGGAAGAGHHLPGAQLAATLSTTSGGTRHLVCSEAGDLGSYRWDSGTRWAVEGRRTEPGWVQGDAGLTTA